MSLATALLVAVVLTATVVIVVATRVAANQHADAQRQAERAITTGSRYEDALGGAYNEWVSLVSYFTLKDPAYVERFTASRQQVNVSLQALKNDASVNDPSQVVAIDAFAAAHERFAETDAKVIDAITSGDLTTALAIARDTNLTKDSGAFLADLRREIEDQRAEIRIAAEHQRSAQRTTVGWSLGIGAMCGLLLLVVALASYRWIGGPLQRASAATRAIAAGDLSARVPSAGPSELANLADDVNTMAAALIARSEELSAYLSKNLESRTRDLELANVALAKEVEDRKRAEEALAQTLATERELEEQLRHQAFHDPLTGLANRARFMDRLDHALLRARRSGSALYVLFLDLDDFKTINDSMGHSAGDLTIREVAWRLADCLRSGDTAARLGGDEFAILLEDAPSLEDVEHTARRLIDVVRAPIASQGSEIVISASIGLAMGDADAAADDLVRNADIAMYVAKSRGKNCYELYEQGMHARLADHLALVADLRHAVERTELVVHYQPTVALESGEAFGAEALVRWNHPTRGLIPPAEFIPLAEDSGDIIAIGRFVLIEACQKGRRWQDRFPGKRLLVNVNVSPKQIQDSSFVEMVKGVVEESGLDPSRLVLEITETAMLSGPDLTIATLTELRKFGVHVALDDFGTGYSSLSFLRRFPIDVLKIDKSFVDEIDSKDRQKLLAKAVIELGQTLDLQVIAEGIERGDQLERLKALDCELGQGFLFSKGLDDGDIDAFFDRALGLSVEDEAA